MEWRVLICFCSSKAIFPSLEDKLTSSAFCDNEIEIYASNSERKNHCLQFDKVILVTTDNIEWYH